MKMKTNKLINLTLAVLMGTSLLAMPVTATTSKPHGTAEPTAPPETDWREDYAYTLGVQAYIFSYPWVFLPEIRYAWVVANEPKKDVTFYMALNQWWHSRKTTTPEYRQGGSPNNDTLYSMSILDLSKEPIILSVPDTGDRYFTFEFGSATSDNFGYVGKRTTGSKAGHYALVGPNWKGKLPAGVQSVAPSMGYKLLGDTGLPYVVSPTNTVYVFGRTAVHGADDAPAVNKIQDQYKLTPLSLFGKKNAKLRPANHNVFKPFNKKTDPLADWKTINKEMTANPPLAQYAALVEQFKTIGIGPGQDVTKMDAATQKGLARAAKDGFNLLQRIGKQGAGGRDVNGFFYPPKTMGSAGYFGDLTTRAAVQCMLGIISNDTDEAVYINTHNDPDGNKLNGTNKYTITFKSGKLPDVKEFWSMTMYDLTNNLVKNPINRYAIGSLSGGFKKAKDGSLTLYIQNESPGKDKEANWLPAPKGDFWVVMRAYGPGKGLIEQTWEMPGLVKVK